MIKKPMLATAIKDLDDISFPVYASPKIDGIRCVIKDGIPLSRSFKKIPNRHISRCLKGLPDGLDGELITGSNFQEATSGIMTESGSPDFTYFVFDYVKDDPQKPYVDRMKDLKNLTLSQTFIKLVQDRKIENKKELEEYEEKALADGFEGVMIRSPDGPYKFGRSSVKEGYLLKLKRMEDSEAEVVGFEEMMTNKNKAKKNELGYTARSSSKSGMKPANTLGKLIVKDLKTGIQFGIGSGLNQTQRKEIWENKPQYIGKIVKYKYQAIGVKDAPRIPIFVGFRSKEDM